METEIICRKIYLEKILKELEKKEKIIDLMVDWFSDYNLYEDDCGNECLLINNSCYEWKYGNKDCKVCIKQYFEKKAEESE